MFSIDLSSWWKMKNYITTHKKEKTSLQSIFFAKWECNGSQKEWAKYELQCLLLIFTPLQNLKSLIKNEILNVIKTQKMNTGIRTHTKEKPFKIFNITVAYAQLIPLNLTDSRMAIKKLQTILLIKENKLHKSIRLIHLSSLKASLVLLIQGNEN